MPAMFESALAAADLNDLLSCLLALRPRPDPVRGNPERQSSR